MLQINKQSYSFPTELAGIDRGASLFDVLNTVKLALARNIKTVVLVFCFVVGLALLFLFTTPAKFLGEANLLIDTKRVQLFQQQAATDAFPVDPGNVLTELAILQSDNVSNAVIKELDLTSDPEFVSPRVGLLGDIVQYARDIFVTAPPLSKEQLAKIVLQRFSDNEVITRVGSTFVMDVGFLSQDPGKAARIANAIAKAYIDDRLQAMYEETRRASLWLQDRIKELQAQVSAADKAAVDFKEKNNINTVDPVSGRLMSEQLVSETNSQLVQASAATADARAKIERMNEIMKQDIPDASVDDSLKSDVIVKLRGEYLDLANREGFWAAKYGVNHLATIDLRNRMAEIKRSIADEMRKIQQSYKSGYDIALAREEAIRKTLDASVVESHTVGRAEIQSRELDSTAQSYKTMYDTLVQRYMEAVHQESFPVTEARIISPATAPDRPARPRTALVLALAILGGGILSVGIAMLREFRDGVFRSPKQFEPLNARCLAVLPRVKSTGRGSKGADNPDRQWRHLPDLWHYAVDEQFSEFSEALRSIKVAIDHAKGMRSSIVIGITSTIPGEGKSTTAANLAQLIAHAGSRALLIDGDLRNPEISRLFYADAGVGLAQLVEEKATLVDVVSVDMVSGLAFLPAGSLRGVAHTSEILRSAKLEKLIAALRERYEYIIVDCSPLAPVVDVRAMTGFIDNYLYLVEWGRTQMELVSNTLDDAPKVRELILGAVLSKVNYRALRRYDPHRSAHHDYRYYGVHGYGR